MHEGKDKENKSNNKTQMPPNATQQVGIMASFVEKRKEREIAAYVKKLEGSVQEDKQHEYISKIRTLLQERVQDRGDMTELQVGVSLAPAVVEVMRQNPSNEKLMCECTRILYLMSKVDPSYKKGVARLFKAMDDHRDNIAIQRAACAAIGNVVAANPDSLPRIAPSIGVILNSMDRHPGDVKLLCKSMEVLADLASHPPSKPIFVSSGALKRVFLAMKLAQKHSHKQPEATGSIQAAACHTLSNLSFESNPGIKSSIAASLPIILAGMKHYPDHPEVQLYGCCALRNLSQIQSEASSAESIPTILVAMREHPDDPMLQEQGCAALCNLLSRCPVDVITSMTSEGGISTVLGAMSGSQRSQADDVQLQLQIQLQGLGVLSCLSSRVKENNELILSEGGLDVIIAAMTTFEDNIEVAQRGCEILKTFTRQSLDFQRAVSAKGGIGVVLIAMRRHVQSVDVQDSAFACMRNLCTHKDNRLQMVKEEGGVGTMLLSMTVYSKDAAIQAYGCDALGRLATIPENIKTIEAENGMDVAVDAMKEHPGHAGVQDRAIFMLLAMAEYPPALTSMREKKILPILMETKVPAKKEAIDRLDLLISHVRSTGWFGK
jgi:hypothetical protein